MASVHKNRSANWFAAYYGPDGTRKFKSTGTSNKKKAEQIARQFESAARMGRADRLTIKRARDVISEIYNTVHGEALPSDKVGEFFQQWIKRKEAEVADASFPAYQQVTTLFLEHVKTRIDKPLDTISRAIISDFRDKMLERVAAATVKKYITLLATAFSDAVKEGRGRENPCVGVTVKQRKSGIRQAFSFDDVQRMVNVAPFEWQGMIYFGFYCGMRLGDIATLQWDSINLLAGEVRFTARKTSRSMVIPLARPVLAYLNAHSGMDVGGAIFPEIRETYLRAGASTLSNRFRRIMVDAKLIEKQAHTKQGAGRNVKRTVNALTFHCLRHSLVSNLKDSGAGDSIAKELAGHSSDEISRVYTHSNVEKLREAVNALPVLKLPSDKTAKTDKTP